MRQVYIKWQFVLIVLLLCNCTSDKSTTYLNGKNLFQIRGDKYKLLIEPENFTFYFTDRQDHVIVPAHSYSGLTFSGSKVVSSEKIEAELNGDTRHLFLATNEIGEKAIVQITLEDGIASFKIKPQKEQFTKTSLSLGGMSVAHGLGDAGAYEESFNLITNKREEYSIENNGGQKRWASSFVIFPQNDVAGVFFGDGKKSVSINEHEYTMSITKKGEAIFYYFLGKPAQIYKSYKTIRNQEGFADIKPKFRLFELGWESWDALGWNTNQTTVKEILEKFHKKGYPIRWAVTGSGFWEAGGTTTNFGKWGNKFPNPETFKTWMHDHDIKWMIGLRTNFVPKGGPYIPISSKRDRNLKGNSYNGNLLSEEGIESNYFVKDISGDLVTVTSQWFPQVPCYLLDGDAPGAARWYQNKYLNWKVDGIKEDTMMDIDSLQWYVRAPGIFRGGSFGSRYAVGG